jgi:hypothetical protein
MYKVTGLCKLYDCCTFTYIVLIISYLILCHPKHSLYELYALVSVKT